jgi:hypothetical protein
MRHVVAGKEPAAMSRTAIARDFRLPQPSSPALSPAPAPDFDAMLRQAEHLHRTGHQRSALTLIAQLAQLVADDADLSLDALLNLIFLRKRVCAALQDI